MACTVERGSGGFNVHVEIRPLLQVANICFERQSNERVPKTRIVITSREIAIYCTGTNTDENEKLCLRFPDVEFVPDSCSGLVCNSSGFQFRVQLESEKLSSQTPNIQDDSIQTSVPYRGCCSFCATDILNPNTSFTRVLPLPSKGSLEAADDWFCHKHGECDELDLRRCFEPKDHECLTGEDYFLVNSRAVDLSQVLVDDNNVTCKRCLQTLGKTTPSSREELPTFHLYSYHVPMKSEIQEKATESPCSNSSPNLKKTLTALLKNNYNGNLFSRVILKTTDDTLPILLLWIMEGEMRIFTETLMRGDQKGLVHGARKILYNVDLPNSELVKQWQLDSNLETISISKEFQNAVTLFFTQNTSKLPIPCRKADLYWIAYL